MELSILDDLRTHISLVESVAGGVVAERNDRPARLFYFGAARADADALDGI